MKICMVTGGSGGHIYPALTFADYVKKTTDYEVFFIGNDHKMESEIIPNHGYDFYAIHNQGLQGSVLDKIIAVLGQFKAISQAKKHLKRLKPDVVFTFGGYVSLPVVLAAKQLKIDVVLHEQNAFVGKANRMSAKYAKALFTSYEEAFKGEPHVYYYGNPRASLAIEANHSDAELKRIGLDKNRKLVLAVMGSQGSLTMNEVFKEMIHHIDTIDYQIVFVSGKNEYQSFMRGIDKLPEHVFVEDYINQSELLPFVDLIVARAGASTITEIVAFDLPSILVPSPYVADNHQYFNAKSLADKHAAVLIEEKDVTALKLLNEISSLLSDSSQLATLKANLTGFKKPNVNKDILKTLEGIINDA